MGKGVIKEHIGDGKYLVEVQYDRAGITEKITELQSLISRLDEYLESDEITDMQAAYAKALKLSAQKRISYLQDPNKVPQAADVEAWCADLSTALAGDVGLIEINREAGSGVNVYPGYGGAAEYSSARDGIAKPTMALDPAAVWVNLGFLPGAQKWRPRYRYGTIQAIDYGAGTCDVVLDNIKSSQQALSVNQSDVLSAVPFDYMSCDGAAFASGDHAIIEFSEYAWDQCKVIGFVDHPRPCLSGVVVVASPSGNEAFAWDIETDSMLVSKDTRASVEAQLAAMNRPVALQEATSDKLMCHARWADFEEYGVEPPADLCPWSHRDTWDWYLSNPSDQYRVYHPENGAPQFLAGGLAFGNDFDTLVRWGAGDNERIVFKTYAGSDAVDVVAVVTDPADGYPTPIFQPEYVTVMADTVITETWTLYAIYSSSGPAFYIKGESVGWLKDYLHNDGHGGWYPYTQFEHASIDFDVWKAQGLHYTVPAGNYITNDAGEVAAPYIYHWSGSAHWKNPEARAEWERQTGDEWPLRSSGEGYKGTPMFRSMLYYAPIFAIHESVPASFSYLDVCSGYSQLIDLWADGHNQGSYIDYVDAHLYLTTGKAGDNNLSVAFSACNLRNNLSDQDNPSVHIYCRMPPGKILTDIEQQGVALVNAERVNLGLDALAVNLNLQRAAERHLQDMVDNYELYSDRMGTDAAHYGTDATDWMDRAEDAGYWWGYCIEGAYYRQSGENLASVIGEGWSVQDIVAGWMASPDHRPNIVNDFIIDTGFAHGVAENGEHFFCQVFGYRSSKWPGYGPLSPDGVNQYMRNHFNWSGSGDESRIPKVYLG